MLRARDVFGQKRLIIVSQRFHVDRALFLARHEGIEAWGFEARDVDRPTASSPSCASYPSALRAYYDVWTNAGATVARQAGRYRSRPAGIAAMSRSSGTGETDRLAGEMVVEVLAHQRGHAALGMLGAAAEMRRHHQVVERQQLLALVGLLVEDVERRALDHVVAQRLGQRRLVDRPAAR